MKETLFPEILPKAKQLNSEGKKWHFHLLGKSCQFNEAKGRFVIVFECGESGEVFHCVFQEKPLAQAKELADQLYGKNFLQEKGVGEHKPQFDLMLEKAKELSEKGVEWHHHHLPPKCIFNSHPGKHCIVLEDESTGEALSAVYESKPMHDLVNIEKLFYQNLPKTA